VASGEGSFRSGRLCEDHVAEWGDALVVRTDASGAVRELWTDDDIPPSSIEKLKRGVASAFVRAVRGELSWHAAAVACEGGGVLLLGESGAGKSTAAYALCRDHGAALLADDVAAIDGAGPRVTIEPTEPVLWLCEPGGSARAKQPQTARTAMSPCVLTTCAFLAFDDSAPLRARALGGSEGFQRLLAAMLRFIPSPERWRRELDVIARIAEQARCFEVVRGKETDAAATAECLLKLGHLDDHGSGRLAGTARLEGR
jgi:hypothetical protein